MIGVVLEFQGSGDQGGVEASCCLHGPGVGFCGNIANGPAPPRVGFPAAW